MTFNLWHLRMVQYRLDCVEKLLDVWAEEIWAKENYCPRELEGPRLLLRDALEQFEGLLLSEANLGAGEPWPKLPPSASDMNPGQRVKDVHVTDDTLAVDLMDGRTIIVPLVWFPRLLEATPTERNKWTISGAGYGIHWRDLDEDLSTEGLLRGAPPVAANR